MDVGILWYDDDTESRLGEKVARAVAYVRSMHGVTPTVCFVNPEMLPEEPEITVGVQLRPDSAVPINHFWFKIGSVSAYLDTRIAMHQEWEAE